MSMDVFLFAFREGKPARFDRSIVERAFPSGLKRFERDLWSFLDPRNGEYYGDLNFHDEEGSTVTGFSLNRPPFMIVDFSKGLFEVLRQTSSIFVWPGDEVWACATSADVLVHAPSDLFDSPSQLAIISSPEEIDVIFGVDRE